MAADALDLAIANADAKAVNFSPMDVLAGGAKAGQQIRSINAFSGGVPMSADGTTPDYNAMANVRYKLGDIEGGNTLANIGIQRQFQQQIPKAINFLQTGTTGDVKAPNFGQSGSQSYAQNNAQAESGGDPNAVNPKTGAAGLQQFLPSTWADLMRRHPELMLTPDGIKDPAQQSRAFPVFTQENAGVLKQNGIEPNDQTLRVAHVLGGQGGSHFIQGMQQNPDAPAASLAGPQAVAMNRSLFFAPNGQPLTAQQTFSKITAPMGQPASVNASAISGTNPELTGLVPNGMDPNQFRTGLRTFGALMSANPTTAALGKALTDQADKIDKALIPTNEQKNYYADRKPGESMTDYNARAASQSENAKAMAAIPAEQYKEAAKNYSSAQSTLYRLGIIDKNIDALGPNWMGAGANTKAGLAKSWNSLIQTAGLSDKLQINPEKVATWEDINKQTTNLGFELAKTLGSREAQMIVQQSIASVPGAQQTYLGSKLVSASLRQAAQRQQDYYEFLGQHPGQLGADILFNKTHPVQQYVDNAIQSVGGGQQAQAAPGKPMPGQIVVQNGVRFQIQQDGSGRPLGQ